MGRYERKLDHELIARMANGWRVWREVKPLKRQKPPRPCWTYRSFWREAWKKQVRQ